MARQRTVQHKAKRDERKTSQELAALKRDNRALQRRLSRLQKENQNLRAMIDVSSLPDMQGLAATIDDAPERRLAQGLEEQLFGPGPKCPSCGSFDVKTLNLPSGRTISGCVACGARNQF